LNVSQKSDEASKYNLIVLSKDAASQRFAGVSVPKEVRTSLSIFSVISSDFQKVPSEFEIVLKSSISGAKKNHNFQVTS
jgi:hypothetical protein